MDKSSTNLDESVIQWLTTEGYPLEYRTARALQQQGFTVSLGEFISHDSSPPREVDVIGTRQETLRTASEVEAIFACHLLCECKHIPDGAWILLGGSASLDCWEQLSCTPGCNHVPRDPTVLEKWTSDIAGTPLLTRIDAAAKSVVVMGRKTKSHNSSTEGNRGRDTAYEALQKVAHLGWAAWNLGVPLYADIGIYTTVFPCIVLDGPLYSLPYNAAGDELAPKRIDCGVVRWGAVRNGTMVHVVTKQAFPQFAADAMATCNVLINMMTDARTTYWQNRDH